ncbi:immunoglobulin binding protein Tap42 [Tachypleus tridentatus]|uniref:immunoglobulin binding protein Tap42 n=1 Tax=Tachypleus tridentatus TaxID=6853 RepID=UPI003FD12F3B
METKRHEESPHSLENLSSFYSESMKKHASVINTTLPSNDEGLQEDLRKAIKDLEEVTQAVTTLGIFSNNEDIDELPTSDIKYLLLPALLGSLTNLIVQEDRMEVVRLSEVYFRDFLQRCNDYNIEKIELPECDATTSEKFTSSGAPINLSELTAMGKKRQEKIARYKKQKEIEKKLNDLEEHIENPSTDEEIVREYWLLTIKKWISTAVDELGSLETEKPILEHLSKRKIDVNKGHEAKNSKEKKKVLKPIIITRNEMQKKVFGAGYPGIPAMTVDEFYEQKYRDNSQNQHKFPVSSLQHRSSELDALNAEKEEIEKEQKEETEDHETLKKAREWDEWKDDHRRGWGNRKNMG